MFSNRPSLDSSFSGGIVARRPSRLGADPTDNVVSRNVAFHNKPADIVWDLTGTGNRFRHNLCARSLPSWICDH